MRIAAHGWEKCMVKNSTSTTIWNSGKPPPWRKRLTSIQRVFLASRGLARGKAKVRVTARGVETCFQASWRSFRMPSQMCSSWRMWRLCSSPRIVSFSSPWFKVSRAMAVTMCVGAFSALSRLGSHRTAHGFSSLVFLHQPEQPITSSGQSWVRVRSGFKASLERSRRTKRPWLPTLARELGLRRHLMQPWKSCKNMVPGRSKNPMSLIAMAGQSTQCMTECHVWHAHGVGLVATSSRTTEHPKLRDNTPKHRPNVLGIKQRRRAPKMSDQRAQPTLSTQNPNFQFHCCVKRYPWAPKPPIAQTIWTAPPSTQKNSSCCIEFGRHGTAEVIWSKVYHHRLGPWHPGTEKLTSCCRTESGLPDQVELQHEKKFSEAAFSDFLRKFNDKDSISLISMVVPTWLAIWHRGRLSKLSRRASGWQLRNLAVRAAHSATWSCYYIEGWI